MASSGEGVDRFPGYEEIALPGLAHPNSPRHIEPPPGPTANRRSSIRLARRASTNSAVSPPPAVPSPAMVVSPPPPAAVEPAETDNEESNTFDEIPLRRRSLSEPQFPQRSSSTRMNPEFRGASMVSVPENEQEAQWSQLANQQQELPSRANSRGRVRRMTGSMAFPHFSRNRGSVHSQNRSTSRQRASTISVAGPADQQDHPEYGTEVVDLLDLVDPEISTLNTLTNVQNSLFVPNLGSFLNRRAKYMLDEAEESDKANERRSREPSPARASREYVSRPSSADESEPFRPPSETGSALSLTSHMETNNFAVLPHGVSLDGWTEEDKEALNDHVRHMLHSKRSKFRRGLRGFGQYVSKPLGLFVTIYATCITVFGLTWVLFLIGWINVGGRQLYIINVIDNVLVALFAVMGDGLAPFRAIDTYHMIFIAHYHHLTWRKRKERNLPDLHNKNDLPLRHESGDFTPFDVEKNGNFLREDEYSILTYKQQQRLVHHQNKFAKSHTFYKPHETVTHYAFSLNLLVAIVVLLDFHSVFQIVLGSCTWSIDYHVRPFALTTVILCFSLACNITGGVLIALGDRRSRKKEVVKRMFRQGLTASAIKKVEKKKRKREKQLGQIQNLSEARGSDENLDRQIDHTKDVDLEGQV